MKLKVGRPAIPFTAVDIHDRPVVLQDLAGQWLLLEFLRFAACPRCNFRIYGLSLHYPELRERGIQVVAFVESPKDQIVERVNMLEAPFPIIADPEQRFYKQYGVKNSRFGLFWGGLRHKDEIREAEQLGFGQPTIVGNDYRMPANFILDPQQIVRLAHYGRHSADTLPLDVIEASVPAIAGNAARGK